MRWDLPLVVLVGIVTSLIVWFALLVAVGAIGVPGGVEALLSLVVAVGIGIWTGRRVRARVRARSHSD